MDSTQWLQQYASWSFEDSLYSTRHRSHSQWPLWEPPVYQNSYLWYYPLVNGQRNVQLYNNSYLVGGHQQYVSDTDMWHIDSFMDPTSDLCGADTLQAAEETKVHTEEDWIQSGLSSSPEEEVAEVSGSLTFSFAESFFSNPFAVSFPGDLPCPTALTTQVPSDCTSSLDSSSDKGDVAITSTRTNRAPLRKEPSVNTIPTPASTVNTPSTLRGRVAKTKKESSFPTKYGPEIHFVDMADKKGAQRIRNTINSRKHRQNKLDKIRELEKKLADLEAEKSKWHQEVAS